MHRFWVAAGSISALLAVAAGAFAAHGLKDSLAEAGMLDAFQTGVRYQMAHALGMIAAGLWTGACCARATHAAGGLFLAGTVIFSGSLYGMALTGIGWLGALTPVGGVALILGWAALAVSAILGPKEAT